MILRRKFMTLNRLIADVRCPRRATC
jgi:hypothetical protein